ncbi:MAG: hypothetical protein QXF31_00205, partial [Candidatus Bathyarchaeia archaeon]
GKTFWCTRLEPIGSALFVLKADKIGKETFSEERAKICEIPLEGLWRIRRLNPNILVLDYCRYRIRGAWSDNMPVYMVHDSLVQSGLGTRFSLRFEFESEIELKGRSIYLVIERPERFKIYVNGVNIEPKSSGYWLDWNFPMIDISGLVGKGLNIIEFEGVVGSEPELENIYLLGDFGVKVGEKGTSKIIEEPLYASLGDLCKVGYPFYAGEIELAKHINLDLPEKARATIRLEEPSSSLAIIYVNGKEAGKAILPPYDVDVTSLLRSGENEIKILLVGSLRNALGPLHYKGGEPLSIRPETFRDMANWTDEYMLRPFGVKSVKILVFK